MISNQYGNVFFLHQLQRMISNLEHFAGSVILPQDPDLTLGNGKH
jgi:hypothetical protein